MIKALTSLNELQENLENEIPLENITLQSKLDKITKEVSDTLNGVFVISKDEEIHCLEISKNSLRETLLELVRLYTSCIKEFSIKYCYIRSEYKLEKIKEFLVENNVEGKVITETELTTFLKLLRMKEID